MSDELRDELAEAIEPIIMTGRPDSEVGPATRDARQETRGKADRVLLIVERCVAQGRAAVAEEIAQAILAKRRRRFDAKRIDDDADWSAHRWNLAMSRAADIARQHAEEAGSDDE